ncbi:MAG TPA: BTAD domain-containing putative transcriptional regulator [Phototrophicaceae bacterium]|nr:BTAD domain-containing putative transcriptional regulator [Phototrophicaceae bacterium]
MLVHDVTHVSLDSFRQRSAGKKVVLIYPWTNYRNLFLTYFLASAREGLLYYRINDQQVSLTDWLAGLLDEFQSVLGNFGKNLQHALAEGKPADIGEALAADLGAYSSDPLILFVDELDRVAMDADFNQFIRALVGTLPDNVQIAFSSRLLTYQPWYDMVARGDAIVLGTAQRKDDMMFTVETTPRPQLEVYGFGRGHALVNGQPITNWDGALPRNLFFFFMDHPLVTRDEIFETFWPGLSVKEATNVFHVTKRKITERISMKISENGSYELTQYNSGFYMPSDKVVRHYDVGDFQEAVDKAMVAASEKEEVALLSRAIDIYKAPFLQTIEMKWVVDRRSTLRQLYAQALIGMGRIYVRRNEDQRAIGFFSRSLKETPEREDIHRQVMNLYINMGLLDDAVMQYRKLEQILGDTLKIQPSRETRDLYEQIEAKRR